MRYIDTCRVKRRMFRIVLVEYYYIIKCGLTAVRRAAD
jgi:hypothetical protein